MLQILRGDRTHPYTPLNEMTRANPSPRTYLLGALTFAAFGQKD